MILTILPSPGSAWAFFKLAEMAEQDGQDHGTSQIRVNLTLLSDQIDHPVVTILVLDAEEASK